MTPRVPRTAWLCAGFVAALAALACALLWMAYGSMVVQADTSSYLYLGRQFITPSDVLWEAARGPGFGLLLWAALSIGHPQAPVYLVHSALFSCSMLLAWLTASRVLGGPLKGLAAACALLAVEAHAMGTLFFGIQLLSEALYSHLLFCGAVLAASGIAGKRRGELLAGCALLGLSGFVRPMHAMIVLFAPVLGGLWLARRSTGVHTATAALCLVLLLLPTAVWKARLLAAYGSLPRNPFIGLHLTSHASALVAPGDTVFDDPAVNARFHDTVEGRLPHADGAWDPFGNPPNQWQAMLSFYGSLTEVFQRHGPDLDRLQTNDYGLAVSRISTDVTLRLIRLHPARYAGNALGYYARMFNPSAVFRLGTNAFQADPAKRYGRLLRRNWAEEEARRLFYGTDGYPSFELANPAAGRILSAVAIRAPEKRLLASLGALPAAAYHLLLALAVLLLLPAGRAAARRMPGTDTRLLGWTVGLLVACACAQYAASAAVTLVGNARFSIPGSLGLHFAAILAAGALLRRRPRAGAMA